MIGGIILAKAGFNAVFILTLGILGLDVFLRLIIIEKKVAIKWLPASPGVLSSEETRPKSPEETVNIDAELAQKEVQVTILRDDGVREPLAPVSAALGLLLSQRLLVALWASAVVGALFAGLETVLPLQTKAAFGWGSIGGGLIFLPLTIPAFFGPFVGWMCDKYGVCISHTVLFPCLSRVERN